MGTVHMKVQKFLTGHSVFTGFTIQHGRIFSTFLEVIIHVVPPFRCVRTEFTFDGNIAMNNQMFSNSVFGFPLVFTMRTIQWHMFTFVMFLQFFQIQKFHVTLFAFVIENVIFFTVLQKSLHILTLFVTSLTKMVNSLKVTLQSHVAFKLQMTKLAIYFHFEHFEVLKITGLKYSKFLPFALANRWRLLTFAALPDALFVKSPILSKNAKY